METAFILMGSVFLWAYIASRAQIPELKTILLFQTILLAFGVSWIGWYSIEYTELEAMRLWRWLMTFVTFTFLMAWTGFWITGSTEKEEIQNDY